MWLYRGVQSAVFYYASCTPCANSLDRRKRKNDAARSRREKERSDAIVTDQPRPFPQPTPFSTNQGWMEEIALGPGPPARRGGRAMTRPESWSTDAFSGNSSQDLGLDGPSQKKDKGSSLKHPRERWNRRYQREDEPLWGEDAEVKGSSIGLSGRGRADSDAPSKYYIARVPPVNDLHPPIVSGPKSRAETRWMLQPPPSAKVMAGKERFGAARNSNRCSQIDEETAEQATEHPTQNPEKKTLKPSPIPLSADHRSPKAPTPESNYQFPRRPTSTVLAHGHDESNFVIAHGLPRSASPSTISTIDSEARSPSVSFQCPVTPASRPGSKATDDIRPPLSKTLSTVQRGNTKNVHLLHLEINDDLDEVGLGQLEQYRPYRWSMDI